LVAHCFREAGVGGSNPLIPIMGKTSSEKGFGKVYTTLAEPFLISLENFRFVTRLVLYTKIQEMLDSPYRGNWSLDELFVEADRIGKKYQSGDEIETFERKFAIVSQEIEEEIERCFPDTEAEVSS
jgi:hypothetical protein